MKKSAYFTLTIIGFTLTAAGIYMIKTNADPQGIMRALPYICVGVGCGAFGHGLGEILSKRATATNLKLQEQITIEKNDERNIMIADKAKGKAYDAMIYIYGALMLSFALMDQNLTIILLLACAYLIVIGIALYYRIKYDKEL